MGVSGGGGCGGGGDRGRQHSAVGKVQRRGIRDQESDVRRQEAGV